LDTVRPEPFDAVRPEPFDAVRPELVEGTNGAQDRLVEGTNGAQDRLVEACSEPVELERTVLRTGVSKPAVSLSNWTNESGPLARASTGLSTNGKRVRIVDGSSC
jgi:hypothetical protein